MGYISRTAWRDLTDGHLYREGDRFPFDGREIPTDRLEELESGRNGAGLRLITADEQKDDQKDTQKEEAPKTAPVARKTAPAKKPAAKKTTKK